MAARSLSLQAAHAAETRDRILTATAELIVEEHPAALSIPAVAARAGMSVRTVYRHYPTKEALLDAVATMGDERSRGLLPEGGLRLEHLRDYMPHVWRELVATRALTAAQYATPLGNEMRKARAQRRLGLIRDAIDAEGLALDPDDRSRLESIIAMLMSRTALFELTDVLGLSVEDAAALAVWTVEVAVEAARTKKEVGR